MTVQSTTRRAMSAVVPAFRFQFRRPRAGSAM
jgi:hypothetical protein